MSPEEILARWQKILRLRGWTITRLPRADRPEPSKSDAYSEIDIGTKTAKIWADTERQIIHELGHIVVVLLDDTFWRTTADRHLRREWNRRVEDAVKRYETAIMAALKEGARRARA